jgi:hypothetical protein
VRCNGKFLDLWNKVRDKPADQFVRFFLSATENLVIPRDDRHRRDIGKLLIPASDNISNGQWTSRQSLR